MKIIKNMKIIKIEHIDTKSIGGSIQNVIERFNIIYEDGTINKFKISLIFKQPFFLTC